MINRLWKRWAWLIVLVALWFLFGWERAISVVGGIGLIFIAISFYERFCDVERRVTELQANKKGE